MEVVVGLLFVVGVVALLGGGALLEERANIAGFCWLLVGIVVFIFVLTFVSRISKGNPITDIHSGEYRVAFVFESGDRVSLGIITTGSDYKKDHLTFYQFEKNAFDGSVNLKATKLIVVKAGSFKKLKLE